MLESMFIKCFFEYCVIYRLFQCSKSVNKTLRPANRTEMRKKKWIERSTAQLAGSHCLESCTYCFLVWSSYCIVYTARHEGMATELGHTHRILSHSYISELNINKEIKACKQIRFTSDASLSLLHSNDDLRPLSVFHAFWTTIWCVLNSTIHKNESQERKKNGSIVQETKKKQHYIKVMNAEQEAFDRTENIQMNKRTYK